MVNNGINNTPNGIYIKESEGEKPRISTATCRTSLLEDLILIGNKEGIHLPVSKQIPIIHSVDDTA